MIALLMRYNVTHTTLYAMTAKKTTTLNLRIDPAIKEVLKIASDQEHRSITNFIELLVRRHCEQAGISIPEQRALFEERDNGH